MSSLPCSEPSVVISGRGIAEIWCGPALLGIASEQDGEIVLRLESHARGLTVSAEALERALAEAREGLTLAVAGPY